MLSLFQGAARLKIEIMLFLVVPNVINLNRTLTIGLEYVEMDYSWNFIRQNLILYYARNYLPNHDELEVLMKTFFDESTVNWLATFIISGLICGASYLLRGTIEPNTIGLLIVIVYSRMEIDDLKKKIGKK